MQSGIRIYLKYSITCFLSLWGRHHRLWGQENGSSVSKEDLLLRSSHSLGKDIREQDVFAQVNVDKQVLERVDTLLNAK